ncbi:MAG: molybdopterin-dependent oxidoreductase [Syntrophomonadaceae bacterium]|nr:molybdopterin-dependent oxidoreductase [Syntrophomonadaceae bacterium]
MSPSFGRGAMTNSWQDMQNSEVFLIAGSNCAECHPIAWKWINRAKAKGAKVIVVDPRFTRTASKSDIFAQIRPGTDIAYLGAMINYIIENKLYDEYYVKTFTNALLKVSKDFKFEDGMFSGFNAETKKYAYTTWGYQLDAENKPVKADSLDDPDCAFAKLKEHFSRYTFETAENITGIPAAKIKEIADVFSAAKPGNILYALGMTQHTTAVQGIRCYAILQLLLGNMGKAGGGIQALRGEPNVQGSTDMANLNANLPGYIPYPTNAEKTLQHFAAKHGAAQHRPIVALLKAWFGKNATAANNYGYDWLPKNNPKNMPTQTEFFGHMEKGQFKLLFNFGSNSTVSIPDRKIVARGLSKLEMLVVTDIFETETAQFWREPGIKTEEIQTEVIFLPAAFVYEKAGTMTNSSRLIQWKEAALEPLNQSLPDLDMVDLIFKKMRELYAGSTDPKDAPILNANWDYGKHADPLKVLEELNGYNDSTGKLTASLGEYLNAPIGTVSTGCWVYAGVTGSGNLANRRNNADPTGLGLNKDYAFAWPGNIRVLYNRASCDAKGQPVDEKRKLIWWDAAQGIWTGNDGPDVVDKTKGPDTPEGKVAFKQNPEGVGRLFTATYVSGVPATPTVDMPVPTRGAGMTVDGPMPEFYEPIESPTANILHPNVQNNPCAKIISTEFGDVKDYPYVLTTYGVVEHFCAGAITRNIPWLNEIMPEPFAEISKSLAKKIGVKEGDKVEVSSARGKLVVRAYVTDRIQPYKVNGKDQEHIGMPWSWGFASLSPGPSTNNVTMAAIDPGAGTPEYKCCLVNIRRA